MATSIKMTGCETPVPEKFYIPFAEGVIIPSAKEDKNSQKNTFFFGPRSSKKKVEVEIGNIEQDFCFNQNVSISLTNFPFVSLELFGNSKKEWNLGNMETRSEDKIIFGSEDFFLMFDLINHLIEIEYKEKIYTVDAEGLTSVKIVLGRDDTKMSIYTS